MKKDMKKAVNGEVATPMEQFLAELRNRISAYIDGTVERTIEGERARRERAQRQLEMTRREAKQQAAKASIQYLKLSKEHEEVRARLEAVEEELAKYKTPLQREAEKAVNA